MKTKTLLKGSILFFLIGLGILGLNIPAHAAFLGDVVINEIAWAGTASSSADEWIELYNNTENPIDISGWSIYGVDTGEILNFSDADGSTTTTIPQKEYLIYANDDAVFSAGADIHIWDATIGLNNESPGQLILYDGQNGTGNTIDTVEDGDGDWFIVLSRGESMERINPTADGTVTESWAKNDGVTRNGSDAGGNLINGTPGALNSAQETPPPEEPSEESSPPEEPTEEPSPEPSGGGGVSANRAPTADAGSDLIALAGQEIGFDGSKSTDPDKDILSFFWNFGDGVTSEEIKPTHTFLYPGNYLVVLEVSDGKIKSTNQITVTIYSQGIVVNEFLPNPKGDDKIGEWIEIRNSGDLMADLSGWQLDDEKEGSQPFIFPNNSLLSSHQHLVLSRQTTGLALNNDGDKVRLLYPNGQIASQVSYGEKAPEGQSSARDSDGSFLWTTSPTPGFSNIITTAKQSLNIIPDSSQSLQTNYPPEKNLEVKLESNFSQTEYPPSSDNQEPETENSPPASQSTTGPDESAKEQLALAKEPVSNFSTNLKLFLVAFGLGAMGAIGLLFLKKRLKS